jgi:hypothetical protein
MIGFRVDPKSSIFQTLKRFENLHLDALHKRLAKVAETGVQANYIRSWGSRSTTPYNIYMAIKYLWSVKAGGKFAGAMPGWFTGSTYSSIKGTGTPEYGVVGLEGKWPTLTYPTQKIPMLEVLLASGYDEYWVNQYFDREEASKRARAHDWESEDQPSESRIGQEQLAFQRRFASGDVSVTVGSGGISIKWPLNHPANFFDRIYPMRDYATKTYGEEKYGARARKKGIQDFIQLPEEYVPWLTDIVDIHISKILGLPTPPAPIIAKPPPPPPPPPPPGRGKGQQLEPSKYSWGQPVLHPPSPIRELGGKFTKHFIRKHRRVYTKLAFHFKKFEGLESTFIDRLSMEQQAQHFKGTRRKRKRRE